MNTQESLRRKFWRHHVHGVTPLLKSNPWFYISSELSGSTCKVLAPPPPAASLPRTSPPFHSRSAPITRRQRPPPAPLPGRLPLRAQISPHSSWSGASAPTGPIPRDRLPLEQSTYLPLTRQKLCPAPTRGCFELLFNTRIKI